MIRAHDHVVIYEEHNFYRGRYAIVSCVVGLSVTVHIPSRTGNATIVQTLPITHVRKVNHQGYMI